MMYRHIAAAIAASAALTVATALAQPRTPLEAYLGDSRFATTMCGLRFKADQLGIAPGPEGDSRQCILDHSAKIKTALSAALKGMRKQQARAALQEHYLRTMSALEGILPLPDEINIDYTRRQGSLRAAEEDAWRRFELANGQ